MLLQTLTNLPKRDRLRSVQFVGGGSAALLARADSGAYGTLRIPMTLLLILLL